MVSVPKTVATDEMVVVGEASASAENQLCAADCRRHMSIEARDLKPIALARTHNLANLFSRLQGNGTIRCSAHRRAFPPSSDSPIFL